MSTRARRAIVEVREGSCIGCGLCLPDCPAGALAVPDGTSRLADDRCCIGCGACVAACPEGAIRLVEREALPFDIGSVMERLIPRGEAAVIRYLETLRASGEEALHRRAIAYLAEHDVPVPTCRGEDIRTDETDGESNPTARMETAAPCRERGSRDGHDLEAGVGSEAGGGR